MSVSPNRRPKCGNQQNVSSGKYLGKCGQYFNASGLGVKVKNNVTLMDDYAATPAYDPSGIAPYSFANTSSQPLCSPYWQGIGGYDCGELGGGGNGEKPCGEPDPSVIITPTGEGTSSFDVGPYKNWYVQTNDTASYNQCYRPVGFKNAYAYKMWHGISAYDARTYNKSDSFDWCCECGVHNDDTNNPETERYLSISANASMTEVTKIYTVTHELGDPCDCFPVSTCPVLTLDDTITITANAQNGSTINRYSGNLTVNTCASASSGCDYIEDPESRHICENFFANYISSELSNAGSNINFLAQEWCYWINYFLLGLSLSPDVISGGGNTWHVEWHTTQNCYDHCGVFTEAIEQLWFVMDITPNSLDIYTYGENTTDCPRNACDCTDCCNEWIQTSHKTYTFSATSYNYVYDATGVSSWSLDQTFHQEVNGTLSNPYTRNELYSDLVELLDNLPLGDDAILPWRTDNQVTKGPLCHYDERLNYPKLICNDEPMGSGEIYGKPAPKGIDWVWNPMHANRCICTDEYDNRCSYIESYGASNESIGGGAPTAWLDDLAATTLPQGAFVGNGFFSTIPCINGGDSEALPNDGVFWGAKYAEIVFPKPSINFFRPCGMDRFQISESTARCIVSVTDGEIVLEPAGVASIAETDDYVWVCGTADWDGCWKVTKTDGYTYTLQEPRIVSASVLPDDPIADCGTGIMAPLRWQNLQPAICGRIDTTYAASNPLTMSLAESSYLVNGDKVFIVNSTNPAINGFHEVTVLDSNNIAFAGMSSLTNGSAQIYSPYTPSWYWNDSESKGDFAVLKWDFNFRDVGEYYRISASNAADSFDCDGVHCAAQSIGPEPRPNLKYYYDQTITNVACSSSCIPNGPCSPVVAYFSPNSESFANNSIISSSVNYGWGTNVRYDAGYGSRWQGIIKQAIDDPFWQAPPCICQFVEGDFTDEYKCNCTWQSDDGTCKEDVAGDPELEIPCYQYYAMAPQVENRCELPDGAPSLPEGKYLGCVKVSEFGSTPPNGNVCWYPYGNSYDIFNMDDGCDLYYQHSYAIPWITYLNEVNCVCNDGRFATDYEADGILCDQSLIVPAP
jgi:hypothetical protein